MRLKTKLVLAITGLVFLVVCTLSWIFLGQLLRQRLSQAFTANDMVAHQIAASTREALEKSLRGKQVDPNDAEALRAAVAAALRGNTSLTTLMESAISYSPTVFDVSIADSEGRGLLSTDPTNLDRLLPQRQQYEELQSGGLLRLLEVVFGPPRVYNLTLPLESKSETLATVRVGVRTTFLRFVVEPWLIAALTYTGGAILCSLIFAAFLANLALKPIEQIGARLDALALAEAEVAGETGGRSGDAVVLVSHKIERIGRRMRNVEEVFSALKENLDQIMTNLQDGILLYTHDARAVLVSDSVERFLGISRAQILGSKLHDVFPRTTRLGRLVRESFDARMALVQEEITTETGRHVEISLDFIHDDRAASPQETLGALLTLHDVESVRDLEHDLELSRRLAAIGRLTAGVGHEVKNPINAIVVHLELLRNKLGDSNDRAKRHLEVIESEIQRLDRVVQTLVDFSRPVELQLKEQDLRRVVSGVLMLASAELETRDVQVKSDLPDRPVLAKVDGDLLRQAMLNVVLNGAQAMSAGGKLEVRLAEDGRMALLSIHDQGSGIPPEIRDKIFDLYFTTKKDGSGIGLAMTYRIVELHNGSIEVQSDPVQGTTFILRFPLNNPLESRARGYFMPDGSSEGGILYSQGTQRMRTLRITASAALLAFCCAGCHTRKASPTPQQAQAPPLQTEGGTLSPPKKTQPQEKTSSPLASPLPPPSGAAVPLPPPPPPQKVRHRVKTVKPAESPQTAATTTPTPSTAAQNQVTVAASPIGQLTTGDIASGERTKHETADLIGSTQQGLNAIKRPLSQEEKVTAAQIRTFLKQAQQALDSGDTDGAHTLATKAGLLLDELTKP